MRKNKVLMSTIKAAILYIIAALSIAVIIIFTVNSMFGAKANTTVNLINKVAVEDKKNKEVEKDAENAPKATINKEKKQVKNYPEYGTKYATISIPKIDINLPVYFGDTLEVLKKRSWTFKWKLFSRRRWFNNIYGT